MIHASRTKRQQQQRLLRVPTIVLLVALFQLSDLSFVSALRLGSPRVLVEERTQVDLKHRNQRVADLDSSSSSGGGSSNSSTGSGGSGNNKKDESSSNGKNESEGTEKSISNEAKNSSDAAGKVEKANDEALDSIVMENERDEVDSNQVDYDEDEVDDVNDEYDDNDEYDENESIMVIPEEDVDIEGFDDLDNGMENDSEDGQGKDQVDGVLGDDYDMDGEDVDNENWEIAANATIEAGMGGVLGQSGPETAYEGSLPPKNEINNPYGLQDPMENESENSYDTMESLSPQSGSQDLDGQNSYNTEPSDEGDWSIAANATTEAGMGDVLGGSYEGTANMLDPNKNIPTQPNPYGGQPNPYGEQPNPYGEQPNPYGNQPNPYGEQPNPYGEQPNPYDTPYYNSPTDKVPVNEYVPKDVAGGLQTEAPFHWQEHTPQEMMEYAEQEAQRVANDKYIQILVPSLCVFFIGFTLFIAQQMIENPRGCCAKICKCCVGLVRCICFPVKFICCCQYGERAKARRTHTTVPSDGDDLELS